MKIGNKTNKKIILKKKKKRLVMRQKMLFYGFQQGFGGEIMTM